MKNTGAITSGMKAAADRRAGAATASLTEPEAPAKPQMRKKASQTLYLVGAHYPLQVRNALLMVKLKYQTPRNIKQLLGEAINLLCEKHQITEPYRGEE